MENIFENVSRLLWKEYGIQICEVSRMTKGVGGDTFLIKAKQGQFVYKIMDANEMNHPEEEPNICEYILSKGVPVSEFLKNKSGSFISTYDDKRISHVQRFVEGKVFSMNQAPDWFMEQSAILLGKIHNELRSYKYLPMGIGEDFFRYMTPQNAKKSYLHSYEIAKQIGQEDIIEDLDFRIKFVDKIADWKFEPEKLTYCNSHGDYTVNQIICGENKVNAVIDWTCACMHPVIWEITRSFFYAEPSCAKGDLDETKFKRYVDAYCSVSTLTEYDKNNLLKLYLYQLAVCDYYAQFFAADSFNKEEYLLQAKFATNVLKKVGIQFVG